MKRLENKIQRGSALNSALFSDKGLKQFIAEFNFPNPDWNSLPDGFPFCNTGTLNNEEKGLYQGILFAWLTEKSAKLEKGFYGLFLFGNILLFTFLFLLFTGNLLNLILIEVYHTIL